MIFYEKCLFQLTILQKMFIIIYNIIKNYKILLIFVVKFTILYKKYILIFKEK